MKKAFTLLLVTVLFLVTNSILLEAGGESEQAGKKVSLTVWLGVADLVRMCEDAIPEFQKKYPNAQVEVLAFPLREAEKKIALALSGGTAPDVYMLSEAFNLQHMQKGYNAPAPADVSEFVKSKTYPVYVDPMMFQGKVYGVPYFHGHILLFWNKGHFADAGIASQPKNWNEMIDSAKKLAKYDKDGTLTRSGITLRLTNESGAAQKFQIFLRQAGGDIYEEGPAGKWHNAYDNEAGRETLKLYLDLLWKHKVNSPSIQSDFMAFTEGTASMLERGPFVINYLSKKAPDLKYSVAEVPAYKKEGTVSYMHALWVPKTSPNQRAAFDYILTVLGQKYMEWMLRETGWPPCRSDLDMSAVYKDFPEYKVFMDTIARPGYVFLPPAIGPADEIQTKFAQKLAKAWLDPKMLDNMKAIADVIKNAAAETDEILKREGLYGK